MLSERGQACLARCLKDKRFLKCMVLQGVFLLQSTEAAINARGHIMLLASRGSSWHATVLDLAGIYCECARARASGSSAEVEACKYSSQLPPPAPVWQRLQAVRSRLREEVPLEYRCWQSRPQQHA